MKLSKLTIKQHLANMIDKGITADVCASLILTVRDPKTPLYTILMELNHISCDAIQTCSKEEQLYISQVTSELIEHGYI